MSEITTKNKILDTAEKLWSVGGFGVSLRTIIKEAGVNTAAIHYHFGSKDDLIEAVLRRRATPINEERIRLLDELEKRYPKGPLPLDEVLEAFVAPVIRTHLGPGGRAGAFPKCMGRAMTDPDDSLRRILRNVFTGVAERFRAALVRALPDTPLEEMEWYLHFVLGTMAFSIAIPRGAMTKAGRKPAREDPDALLERLVRFCAAGMRAGLTRTSGGVSD